MEIIEKAYDPDTGQYLRDFLYKGQVRSIVAAEEVPPQFIYELAAKKFGIKDYCFEEDTKNQQREQTDAFHIHFTYYISNDGGEEE